MTKGRMEAFSDGVIAIIITIMVLEFKPPHEPTLHGLWLMAPLFFNYVLSFVHVAIYWNNHHHLIHAADKVTGGILWTNMLLLFWLSLVPFTTNWMGEHRLDPLPVATYGFVLMMAGISYYILTRTLIAQHSLQSKVANAIGSDLKGKVSVVLYIAAIPLAFVNPWISYGIYVVVAAMWLVPDKRIEGRV